MNQSELLAQLGRLIVGQHCDLAEFKPAPTEDWHDELGGYVSALANEANLRGFSRAWLVLGVDGENCAVTGTSYLHEPGSFEREKMRIADGTGGFTFRDIHELEHPAGRVLLFEIPPAPRGIPISWNGSYLGLASEPSAHSTPNHRDERRAWSPPPDWTAQFVDGASIDDLDPEALELARERFAMRASHVGASHISAAEISAWSDEEFLQQTWMARDGAITRAALLLLGKPESAWRLRPHPAGIIWQVEGEATIRAQFRPPFLLLATQLIERLDNIQLRPLPIDVDQAGRDEAPQDEQYEQYDLRVVLEALHNSIAHQDYNCSLPIVVTQCPDRLVIQNIGDFFEGNPDGYVLGDNIPMRYRNVCLVHAMTGLHMIDYAGYGISDICRWQQERCLPLPDYDLTELGVVRLTIHGGVIDERYSRLLKQHPKLPMSDVFALDRIQKGRAVSDEVARHLLSKELIEVRGPNDLVLAEVVEGASGPRITDDQQSEDMILALLKQFGGASRREIDDLLWGKLGQAVEAAKKKNKISRLLGSLRKKGRIYNAGSRAVPDWRLVDD